MNPLFSPRRAGAALLMVSTLLLLGGCGQDSTAASPPGVASPATPPTAPAPVAAVIHNAPTITGAPALTATAGAFYVFQPTAGDVDGDVLTFSVQGLPAWLAIDAATGRLSGAPADADVGMSADILLSVTDGLSSGALPPFRIQIAARATPAPSPTGSAPPTISGTAATQVTAGSLYRFTPLAVDADSPTLTYSIAGKPAWASFSSVTGTLQGTPTNAQIGSYAGIVIRVADGTTTVALPAFAVQVVAPPNTPPTISGTPATDATVGAAYAFAPIAADVDGQSLTFSISGKPSWANFSTATGRLSGTPSSANLGPYPGILISVSDGSSSTALPAFTLTVQSTPNRAPAISGSSVTAVVVGSAYGFTPAASDPDGDTLTFSISGKPAWASFNPATGQLSGTPTSAQVGSYTNIVISVSDAALSASLPAFSLTVTAVTTGSATLSWTPPTQNTDGTALATLAGYRIYYGSSAANLTSSVQLTNPGLTSYVVSNLASGTYYFAITAYNSAGGESAQSTIGSKTIP